MRILCGTFASMYFLLTIGLPCAAIAAEQRVKVAIRDGTVIDTYYKTPTGNGPWPAVFKKCYGITTGAGTFNTAGQNSI